MMALKKKDYRNKAKHHVSYLIIPISTFFIFSIGFIPGIIFYYLVNFFISFDQYWMYVFLPFLVYIAISIVLISQMFVSSLIIRLFHIYYKPGTYPYDTREKNALKWMIIVSLYTPIRKMLEIIPMGKLKNSYYRLLGMKIGQNSLVGGVIKDPCITSIGDNTTMGEYAIVYGHIHNFQKGTILIDSVSIGNNCVIGAGAIIMPGVVIEDDVIVAAGALIPKKQRLLAGNMYAGIPAKKL
jgi:hypothetical protein